MAGVTMPYGVPPVPARSLVMPSLISVAVTPGPGVTAAVGVSAAGVVAAGVLVASSSSPSQATAANSSTAARAVSHNQGLVSARTVSCLLSRAWLSSGSLFSVGITPGGHDLPAPLRRPALTSQAQEKRSRAACKREEKAP